MTDQPSHVAVGSEPTEARFSIRSLFIATIVVALFAALVGPLVRRLAPAEQIRLLAGWATWLTVIGAWIAYQARQRFQVERLAGRTLLRLRMFDEKVGSATLGRRWFNIVGAALFVVMLMVSFSRLLVDPPAGLNAALLLSVAFWGALSISWGARVVTMFWWRSNIRFCEVGVLWDRRILRWEYILEHRWSGRRESVLEVRGIDQHEADAMWKIPVPSQDRDALQSILDDKASGTAKSHCPPVMELARLPISTVVKHPYLLDFVVGAFVIVFFFGVGIYLNSTGPTGVPEFDRSFIWGVCLRAIVAALRWRRVRSPAGAPLVRLTGKRGRAGALVSIAAAMFFYTAGKNFGWSSVGMAYATGIGFWWAFISIPLYLLPKRIDLRQHGVSLPGELFWPWPSIRVKRWVPEQGGPLVLVRGYRRIIAKVPPQQRGAVDAVLRDKLSSGGDSPQEEVAS